MVADLVVRGKTRRLYGVYTTSINSFINSTIKLEKKGFNIRAVSNLSRKLYQVIKPALVSLENRLDIR